MKKLWPKYFDAVVSGKKKYELRVNDFDIEEGDMLLLEEWDPETNTYTGRSIEKRVTYVGKLTIDELKNFAGSGGEDALREKGLQIISLE